MQRIFRCNAARLSIRSAILLALTGANVAIAESRILYADPIGTCDGFPRLDIVTAKGYCAGLIVGPTASAIDRPIKLPRSLVELDDGSWLLSDLGGWDSEQGAAWRLQVQAGAPTRITRLIDGLKLPHALAKGPDGKIYVGEMSRIFRFDPSAQTPAETIEVVIENLPDNKLHEHRHPLSMFVFAADGAMVVNVGAPSDQCLDSNGQPRGARCPESEGDEQAASLRRYEPDGRGGWSTDYTILASGLRNSVALAVHASGTIVQAENSYDFDRRWIPFEEINRIEAGRHYGWPYCADLSTPTPGWKDSAAMRCESEEHTRPVLLLPPHAAPLDMLWYDGEMFPALSGRLLMTWHGYRSVGGRIVSFAVDADGLPIPDRAAKFPVYGGPARAYDADPSATAVIMTPGWDKVADVRPQGSPVGLAVARDGSIWTTDDRAGLVIRIATDED